MHGNTVNTSTKAIFTGALLLGIVTVFVYGTATWASTRLGQDIEVQAWCRIRAFMTARPEGFASLEEVADTIAEYIPHQIGRAHV